MNIRMNQDTINVPGDLSTWGDLLDWIETDYLNSGQCITKVSFGPDEALHYRDRSLCDQDLGPQETIDIESGDFDSVVRESLGELEKELGRVTEAGSRIVGIFEERDQERAYTELSSYLEDLGVLCSIFSEDLGWVDEDKNSRAALMAALEHALGELISAQENGFWISVCDVLEYEIAPILEGWKKLVHRTRGQIN